MSTEILEQYKKLSEGKKRLLRARYISLFGCRVSFYNKIAGRTLVRKAEELFLIDQLTKL